MAGIVRAVGLVDDESWAHVEPVQPQVEESGAAAVSPPNRTGSPKAGL
jgi:hypothetical protein